MCIDRGDSYSVYVNDIHLDLMGTNRTSFYDDARAGFAWRSAAFQYNAQAIKESWWLAVKSGKIPVLRNRRRRTVSMSRAE
jgi:hypothetical protein